MLFFLQVASLGFNLYINSSQFESSYRAHNLNVLYVDFDGGVVGESVMDAYAEMQGDTFPTVVQGSTEDYPGESEVRRAVCKGHYWAALFANSGASANLSAALYGGTGGQATVSYIWNGARYPSSSLSVLQANLISLIEATSSAYYALNATGVLASAQLDDNKNALQIFLDPIQTAEINIKPTNQGNRVLHDTVSMLFPILPMFFFVMAINGISLHVHIFSRLPMSINYLFRLVVSVIFTFFLALGQAGVPWAFRESWDVNGGQYMLTAMILWLGSHTSFLFFDVLTAVTPLPIVPPCVLGAVIISITSTLIPLELSAGFFRWEYALPAHEIYQVLVQIWSGCNNQLYRALPIMFGWWIALMLLSPVSLWYRYHVVRMEHKAKLEEELEMEPFREIDGSKEDIGADRVKSRNSHQEAQNEEDDEEKEREREEREESEIEHEHRDWLQ